MDIAVDKQAEDVLLLDVHTICSYADYFVLLTADNRRQTAAIMEDMVKQMKQAEVPSHRQEGNSDSGWILLDLGDVIVHIFAPEERSFYRLEELWSRAVPLVRVQ